MKAIFHSEIFSKPDATLVIGDSILRDFDPEQVYHFFRIRLFHWAKIKNEVSGYLYIFYS